MRSYRYYILLMCFAGIACPLVWAQSLSLTVARQGNHLHVAAPQLHFLAGKPLEQLHNGSSVTYVFDLTVTASGASAFSQQERFILSYDLWEEKFSIVQSGAPGRAASHLTAEAAETWCLDNLLVPLPSFSPEKTFMAKLECSIADDAESSGDSSSGLTLAGLIDIFSRKKHEALPRWEAVSGPMRLGDLKNKKQKGSKI
ncbi:MAG: hypothetical protein ABSH28_10835 [Acidobacteriota bacterium]